MKHKEKRVFYELEKELRYTFKNHDLLLQSLTHKSQKKLLNNERLEFLGDAVLDLVVAQYLYEKFTNKTEGDLSKMRANLVNESSFCKIANAICLGKHLNLSIAEDNNGGRAKPSILSDAFEAIMAVIYIESGLEEVKKVFYPLMQKEFFIHEDMSLKDYKSQLQEYTQEIFNCLPCYELVGEDGPDHNKSFIMEVAINGEVYAKGFGNSKRSAQQEAAKNALDKLKK